ncbi:MAG: WS/DGAT domain-containing protein [Solirubrobacteraceae bacterium]
MTHSGDREVVALGAEDRAILALESPTVAGHTCKVIRLGVHAPGVPELRKRIAERIHLTPALTRRLDQAADGSPVWVPDRRFTVDRQIVEHHHGDPVDLTGLRRCVARLFEQRLDRDLPLWRIDVIELLDGDRALVWRLHHALADGTASTRLARALLWDDPPELQLTPAQVVAQHAADDARRRSHLAGYLRREFGRSRARSPFDGPICPRREVAFSVIALGPLRRAAKATDGASLNDAVLCIVAGALRHWVELHHGRLGTIRVKVPVSLHREGDAVANRDSMFSLGLPLHEADPVVRLRTIHARTSRRKEARDAERRELLMHRISGVSPRLERFAEQLERSPRRFALNVSNVPGPRHPVSVLSSRVRALYSIAEISQHHALRVSVMSLADQLSFGFCADPDVVCDVQTIAGRVAPEAAALRAARSG